MTERHRTLHDPHLEDVAVWHLFEGSPTEKVPVDATIGTRSSTGSRRPEGD